MRTVIDADSFATLSAIASQAFDHEVEEHLLELHAVAADGPRGPTRAPYRRYTPPAS